MKKTFLASLSALAFTFVSCGGNSTAGSSGADSAAIAAETVAANPTDSLISSIEASLASGDTAGVEKLAKELQEALAQYPETAGKIASFVADNAEKLVAAGLSAEKLNGLGAAIRETGAEIPAEAREAAAQAIRSVQDKAETAKTEAGKKLSAEKQKIAVRAEETIDETKAKALQKLDDKIEHARKLVDR